ncbi:germ cell nuclear acidic protein [Anastrepha obliqua]|uniref:germ cell nuclear acidic protein n=1 Tax=Anastrepha obliqua TaxID=95512 RepID=UPI002409519E|nr:germ cell nuclear acidic protein [Anastrepha obliqua]
MDEEQKYKLITCVDPRKINVPIRDRFAKLTLSNKKKQTEVTDEFEGGIERVVEPTTRVSRNLLETLDNMNDNIPLTECESFNGSVVSTTSTLSNLENMPQYINPLLRSDSSGSIPVTQINSSYNNDALSAENTQSDDMQPLQVSENFDQSAHDSFLENEISVLTREVSIMAVSAKDLEITRNDKIAHETTLSMPTESLRMTSEFQSLGLQNLTVNLENESQITVSVLAVSAKDLEITKNDKIANETTLSMPTESQRMSSEFQSLGLQTLTVKPANESQIHINTEFLQPECISLSSTEDSRSAITVTDSSVSEIMDFDCMTSDIPESGHSANAFIPNTFSNEKADRMEAFLRDVSQQRRELENHEIEDDNFDSHRVVDKNDLKECFNEAHGYKKLDGLAYADTESMTSFCKEQPISEELDKIIDTKQMQEPQKETLSMSQIDSGEFIIPDQNVKEKSEHPRPIAHEETQANTSVSQYVTEHRPAVTLNQTTNQQEQDCSIVCSEKSFISDVAGPDVPDDSVVISETSSENLTSSSTHDSRCSSREVGASEYSPAIDEENAQQSPRCMDIGSINISAKINIKISISQLDSSEQICVNETDSANESNSCSFESNNMDPENQENKTTLTSNVQELEITCDTQKQDKSIDLVNAIEDNMSEDVNSDDKEEDVNFLTHAERLLNQVYGKSWQTPEVIRTLKRTSRTPKKTDCTPSPDTSKIPNLCEENKSDNNGRHNDESASVEQSILDDFSIFRRDIVRTNLDSTRFVTPNTPKARRGTANKCSNFNSEPRCMSQGNERQEQDFQVPRTEVRRKCLTKRQQNAAATERWRQLVDEDSETSGDNASNDDTLEKTEIIDNEEWSPTSGDSDDSDYKISRPSKSIKQKTKKQQQRDSNSKRETNFNIRRGVQTTSNDDLIYLDLSKDEVTIQEGEPSSPLANNDAKFSSHLEDILRTCKATDKAKLPATPNTGGRSKRKLFTANFGDEDVDLTVGEDGVQPRTPVKPAPTTDDEQLLRDMEQVKLNDGSLSSFPIINKHLEAIKRGDPIFKLTSPLVSATPKSTETPKQIKPSRILRERQRLTDQIWPTPKNKYGFLKSLDVCVAKTLCHPDALCYRENYRTKKEELAKLLYELYNEKLFENKLHVPLQWNKKLCNTAGRCLNKKRMGVRTSMIELSEKVLTSADRLRCTLIHELCHAATWVLNGEGGHGKTWKQWASKANNVFPEIPKIGVCHQYDIEYKYTYKCTLCGAKSHAHSKSKKVENIRCSYCHGAIEIFLNKKDKDGNILPTPVREPTGFAKFVKDNYKQYKRPDLKHADVMKILSTEFAALKVQDIGT